jgi:quercetin dioxygenase-like cupin family protein
MENRLHLHPATVAGLVILLAVACPVSLPAQQGSSKPAPGATRTVLEKHDLSIPGYKGVLERTELPLGAREPRHTHPGDFLAYVEQGTLTLLRDGQPTTTVKAGEVFFVPAGQIHSGENHGDTPVKILVTFIVQKGKPLTVRVE